MNETLKRLLIFLGILVVGILVYIHRDPHKTPREKMGVLAGAKSYSKAASEGDLKSLPPGEIRLYGPEYQWPSTDEYILRVCTRYGPGRTAHLVQGLDPVDNLRSR